MLRDIRTNGAKPADTTHKAGSEMKVGMAVIKNYAVTGKIVDFPTAETAENIYWVTKERVPTGINAARGDMSDYDSNFIDVAEDEFVKLEQYSEDDKFGTDQYVTTDFASGVNTGFVVSVGADGKVKKASTGIKSKYVYTGLFIDSGHELVTIEVIDTPRSNA